MVNELGGNLLAHHDRNWYLVRGVLLVPPTIIVILFCLAVGPSVG